MGAHSYFACQLARPMLAGDEAQARLSKLIAAQIDAGGATIDAKRRFYQAVTRTLVEQLGSFERGVWDYWDEPDEKVQRGFQDWVDGLEGKEGRHKPHPSPDQPRYMAVALAFLLQRGSNSDRTMADACDIEQGDLWRRETFARILTQGVGALNFASVRSDVIYLLPQREDYALTHQDLTGSGDFDYLRVLV